MCCVFCARFALNPLIAFRLTWLTIPLFILHYALYNIITSQSNKVLLKVSKQLRYLKGLSHEVDFNNIDKNWQMLVLISAAAGFWIFRRHLWFLVEIKHPLSGKCKNHTDSCCYPINFVPELPASLSYQCRAILWVTNQRQRLFCASQ